MKNTTKIKSVISGVGAYLPEKILTNDDLSKMVDTTDEWIRTRTGISERHIADKNELTSDLAIRAAKSALKNANRQGKDIELLIVATTTADETFPATATKVQQAIGMINGFAFDVQAACSGFMYALSIADSYIRTGAIRRALIIGAETLSRIVDWSDRRTCVLFGDGAGAVVLEAQEKSKSDSDSGILSILLRSDGTNRRWLLASGGISLNQKAGFIQMEGREIFRFGIEHMGLIAEEILKTNRLTAQDIDFLVPHQANLRMIEAIRTRLNLTDEKVVISLTNQGNTASASIPLALYEGISAGRIKRGDLLLLESMGGGLSWGASLIRY